MRTGITPEHMLRSQKKSMLIIILGFYIIYCASLIGDFRVSDWKKLYTEIMISFFGVCFLNSTF